MSSGFFYKTAEEKEKLVKAERKFIEDRVQKIIDLKDKVCAQLWCSKLASQTTLHSILSVRWQGLCQRKPWFPLIHARLGNLPGICAVGKYMSWAQAEKCIFHAALLIHSFTHTELFIESLLCARNYVEYCFQSLTRVHGNKRL